MGEIRRIESPMRMAYCYSFIWFPIPLIGDGVAFSLLSSPGGVRRVTSARRLVLCDS